MKKLENRTEEEEYNPYCEVCGGCGYYECDGIIAFLDKHIEGKTNCKYEASYLEDIALVFSWEKNHIKPPKKSKTGRAKRLKK
jgi:hypothetical protein